MVGRPTEVPRHQISPDGPTTDVNTHCTSIHTRRGARSPSVSQQQQEKPRRTPESGEDNDAVARVGAGCVADMQWTRPEATSVDDDEIPFHALRRQDGAERTAAPCSLSSSSCSLERLRPRSDASKRHALGRNPARKSVAWRGWRRTSQRVGSGRKHCYSASKHKKVVPGRPLHATATETARKGDACAPPR